MLVCEPEFVIAKSGMAKVTLKTHMAPKDQALIEGHLFTCSESFTLTLS